MTGAAGQAWPPTARFEVLRLRARLLGAVRAHFATTGALEVETPVLVGAAVTDVHLESLEVRRSDGSRAGFLQTSPEYAMKRLLCAGAPDVFQVARVFREGERGRNHNPEFTMVEWYRLGVDHHALMRDVESLLRAMLEPLRPVGPTATATYAAAFHAALGCDPLAATAEEIADCLRSEAIDVPASLAGDRDGLLDLAMAERVAAGFPGDRITFVHDFPASQAALARVRGPVASRFEAFWGGLELANGFHELGDAAEQARRFDADSAARARRGQPARAADRLFLAALGAGLPSCAGVALGFDRVVMVAAGASRIDEVIAFPIERA
ncbi:MAG: EF-P lysine aminoacylase EpmA [Vicinamibacterales bacterium]|nr:EF-P lysine aminoacylase EpmA [Vicinamibacterales bacterium]